MSGLDAKNTLKMLLKEIQTIFHSELDSRYGTQEVTSFFSLLINHFLGLEKFVLILQPNLVVSKEDETLLFKALSELKQDVPVQYIIGETEFMDLKLKVLPDVLIPRPETEDLVRWILDDHQGKQHPSLKILDIGTGSGCIAISLAKHIVNAKVSALDISRNALTIARSNAELNRVQIDFHQVDILDKTLKITTESNFNMIVSNPPYVRELEKNEMHANVLNHEPEIALFVPDKDPLVFYKAIATFAEQHLVANGSLYLEINQYLGKAMLALLNEHNFKNIELGKDIFGNNRMMKATCGGR